MEVKLMDSDGRRSARIDLVGNCAIHEVETLRQSIQDIYDQKIYHVLLDFSGCTFIDSTGLGMLVSIHKMCEANEGRMVVYRPSDEVKELLTMTRLEKVFHIG